jgi:hypothetical protein
MIAWVAAISALGMVVGVSRDAQASIPIESDPVLVSVRTLRTNPFPGGATAKVGDAEGLAYDPVRNTLWLTDDTLGQILEIDYASGELRAVVSAAEFALVPAYEPGKPVAGPKRIGDNEGLAYDPGSDTMYLFSGPCCPGNLHLPTAYRFKRQTPGGSFWPESYQPIDGKVSDFSGAAIRDGTIYVSDSSALYNYDYPSDTVSGPIAKLPFVVGTITGLGFSSDGKDLWVTDTSNDLFRVKVPGYTQVSGYSWLSLSPWGVRDGRAVEVINDQLAIADGYDLDSLSFPDRHAIHVLEFDGGQPPPTTPPSTGPPPTGPPPTGPPPTTTPRPPAGGHPAFEGVTPGRLMDTRAAPTIDGRFQGGGRLAAGSHTRLQVIGRGGVPDRGVGAVAVNITAIDASAQTYLTVWPRGKDQPAASNLNVGPARTVPNMAIVGVGTDGEIELYNDAGTLDVVVDVLGWLPTGAGLTSLSPARLLDTRDAPTIDGKASGVGPLGPGQTVGRSVSGRGGVPRSGAGSVVLNLTAVGSTDDSYLTVWPGKATRPLASNVNLAVGATVANMVVVPLGSDGTVQIYNDAGQVDVVADVLGWFAPNTGFTPLTAARLMDTRPAETIDGLFRASGPVGSGKIVELKVVGRGRVPASGVGAVVLNVTGAGATAASYLTVWPSNVDQPVSSNLNLSPGWTEPNMVIVPVGPDGTVRIYNDRGTVDIIVDVMGWFPGE